MIKPLQKLCNRVDNFFNTKRIFGRVEGGTISEEQVKLYFQPAVHTWKREVFRAIPELSQSLGFDVTAETGQGYVILTLATNDVKAVFERKQPVYVFSDVMEGEYYEKQTDYAALTAS